MYHLLWQVLSDCQRLVKRTQLKRTVYRVLGKRETEQDERGDGGAGEELLTRDTHLKDYDEEIFDDDDFYHQVTETGIRNG